MAEIKTKTNDGDVMAYLNTIEPEKKRQDSLKVLELMKEVSGQEPVMWGTSIIGFGDDSYRTADGKHHGWFRIGFAPRKQSLTLYIMDGFDAYESLLEKLGKHKTGKSCLYIKKLEDIDESILIQLMTESYKVGQ